MNEINLKNRVAVVTGGRRGIGRAVALALAGAGADVVVCDAVLEDGKLDEVAGEIRALGCRSAALEVDIAGKTSIQAMTDRTVGLFGRIDILVNCAGVWIPGQTLLDCADEEWDRVMNTNLRGTYLCCKVVGAVMVKQMRGNIINLSSQVGLNPGVGIGSYSISKAGIIMLTRQLALELAPYHIRVNAIAPGVVMTDFNAALWKDPTMAAQIAGSIPAGRMAQPDDVALPALFLASDHSAYVTGAVINVDGGWQVTGSSRVRLV